MIEPKYSPIYFRAEELLPKELYTLLGRGGLNVFEEYALKGLDQLRAYCGFPILVNDWHKGGKFNNSGFRVVRLKPPESAIRSSHKMGIAFDVKCQNITDFERMVEVIKEVGFMFGISRVENLDITTPRFYLHIEFSTKMCPEIYYFNP